MWARNRLLIFLLITLTVLLVVFAIFRSINRVQITAFYPGESQHLSSSGRIGVTFNQLMEPTSVEARFSLSPPVEGHFAWEGYTLWFFPSEILDPTQAYQVTLEAGAHSQSGRIMQKTVKWKVKVRPVDILYMIPSKAEEFGGELWRYSIDENRSIQLTDTQDAVIDFAPSPTGDRIAYTQRNTGGGVDLWHIDRDGKNSVLLVNCGADFCSEPAWSTDLAWIAYTREAFSPIKGRYLPARVWKVEAKTGQTTPLYQQEDAYCHSPSFSPDGKRLATYDIVQSAIRILDLQTSQESAIPSAYPGVGDWSPDSKALIFLDLSPGVLEPNVGMFIYSFMDESIHDALGEFLPNLDYDPPRWSPAGDLIVYGIGLVGTSAGKDLWVADLESRDAFSITNDPSGSFSNYRWDPWGERLVFQRYAPSGPLPHTSIWIWDRSTGVANKLFENGVRPEWIP